jgi:hypothetical protein
MDHISTQRAVSSFSIPKRTHPLSKLYVAKNESATYINKNDESSKSALFTLEFVR